MIGPERKLASFFQPIRGKNKTYHDLVACVFPRFKQFGCFEFDFSLGVIGIFPSSDWLLWLLWFWFVWDSIKNCSKIPKFINCRSTSLCIALLTWNLSRIWLLLVIQLPSHCYKKYTDSASTRKVWTYQSWIQQCYDKVQKTRMQERRLRWDEPRSK